MKVVAFQGVLKLVAEIALCACGRTEPCRDYSAAISARIVLLPASGRPS